jgi:hypothetical protein
MRCYPRNKMEVNGQLHETTALPPGERISGAHLRRGLVDPRAGLEAVVKRKIKSHHCPRRELNPGRNSP